MVKNVTIFSKIILIITMLILIFSPVISLQSAEIQDSATYFIFTENADNSLTINGILESHSEFQGVLEIPEKINSKTVTAIGENAFSEYFSLTKVILPDTITKIGVTAFSSCVELTQINIPENVISIADTAFLDCLNLTIYGVAGSAAETYAQTNSIHFSPYKTQVGVSLGDVVYDVVREDIDNGYVFVNLPIFIDSAYFGNVFALQGILRFDTALPVDTSVGISAGDYALDTDFQSINLVANTTTDYSFMISLDLDTNLEVKNSNDVFANIVFKIPIGNINIEEDYSKIYKVSFACDAYPDNFVACYYDINSGIKELAYEVEDTFTISVNYDYVPIVVGDINGNGKVNIADLIIMVRYIRGNYELTATEISAADINENGTVSIDDFSMLKQILLKA